jgi:hypothetical protein
VTRPRRGARFAGIALAAAASLAAAGCGDGTAGAGLGPAPSQAGRASGLGVARFRALDALFVSAVATDGLRSANVPTPAVRAVEGRIAASCRALDPRDPLLGALRHACLARLGEAATAPSRCPAQPVAAGAPPPGAPARYLNTFSGGICPSTIGLRRAAIAAASRQARAADRAVAAAALTAACRDALRTPPVAYRLYDDLDAMYASLRLATTAGSAAAQRTIEEIGRLSSGAPSNGDLARRFRAGCG